MISQPYQNIWDGCCDHGLLGQALLCQHPTSTIHFVDITPDIIKSLNQKLKLNYSNSLNWESHCQSLSDISLHPLQSHLIVIAGIGGQLMQTIMADLLLRIEQNNLQNQVEFVICPIHHQYRLREFLRDQNLFVLKEQLIKDNGRFYEIMHLSLNGSTRVNPVGNILWDNAGELHKAYLHKLIQHYQRLMINNPCEATTILHNYQQLAQRLGIH